jgi:hypothetical protein
MACAPNGKPRLRFATSDLIKGSAPVASDVEELPGTEKFSVSFSVQMLNAFDKGTGLCGTDGVLWVAGSWFIGGVGWWFRDRKISKF